MYFGLGCKCVFMFFSVTGLSFHYILSSDPLYTIRMLKAYSIGSLVVTFTMLWRLVNCRVIIIICSLKFHWIVKVFHTTSSVVRHVDLFTRRTKDAKRLPATFRDLSQVSVYFRHSNWHPDRYCIDSHASMTLVSSHHKCQQTSITVSWLSCSVNHNQLLNIRVCWQGHQFHVQDDAGVNAHCLRELLNSYYYYY